MFRKAVAMNTPHMNLLTSFSRTRISVHWLRVVRGYQRMIYKRILVGRCHPRRRRCWRRCGAGSGPASAAPGCGAGPARSSRSGAGSGTACGLAAGGYNHVLVLLSTKYVLISVKVGKNCFFLLDTIYFWKQRREIIK